MQNAEVARRKLVGRVTCDPAFGGLQNLVATTYDLDVDFFETDFLPSLLGLVSWDDRHWSSRIAMERKLALTESVTVFTEARRYTGRPRSLRVELAPVHRAGGSALHAKVVLAVYEHCVRLVVGSANLTERGYRKNREVAAVFTVSEKDASAAPLVAAAIEDMQKVLAPWQTEGAAKSWTRAREFLAAHLRPEVDQDISFFWGGGERRLWEFFLDRWPAGEPVHRISIVSPFWSEDPGHGFLDAFLESLRSKTATSTGCELRLLADARQAAETSFQPVLPSAYASYDFSQLGVNATAFAVDPAVDPADVDLSDDYKGIRALHAKVLLLEGERTSLAYLGSANFTRRGWGFDLQPGQANVEAGLTVLRTGNARHSLQALIPETAGEPISLGQAQQEDLAPPEADVTGNPWPAFIRQVLLVVNQDDVCRLAFEVHIVPELIEGTWRVELVHDVGPGDDPVLLSVNEGDSPRESYRTELNESRLNLLLRNQEVRVAWWNCAEGVNVPLNAELDARHALPISPSGGRLGESELIAYYQGRIAWEDLFPDPHAAPGEANPLNEKPERSTVDTSGIQSYQIREFVEALPGVLGDLRESSHSAAAIRLALFGPVSPRSVARHVMDAVKRGERTPTAAGFQLMEIIACLMRAQVGKVSDAVRPDWDEALTKARQELDNLLECLAKEFPDLLSGSTAFAKYVFAVRESCAVKEQA